MNSWTKKKVSLICSAVTVACLLVSCGCTPTNRYGSVAISYYYTDTDDGLKLALRRYKPGKLSKKRGPVILCHGFSYNLMFWDLAEKVSLAKYLSKSGYDVWSLSLRGSCPSSQPLNSGLRKLGRFSLDPEQAASIKSQLAGLKMTNWSVDDHIKHDVPAAIRFVKEQTGHRQVHWIGHSMGGMISLAYLGQDAAGRARDIKSVVAMAVPMVVFRPLSKPMRFLVDSEDVLEFGSRVVGSSAPATLGALFGDLGTPRDKLFYNSKNLDDDVLRALFHRAEEDISTSQLKQLLTMVHTERFYSLDGAVDYTAALKKIRTPIYFLAGTVDNMATVGAVQYAYREIASDDKQFELFGVVNSQRNDYGHDDIVLGKNARSEVYPTILKWLDNHPSKMDQHELMMQPSTGQAQHEK